MEVCQQFIGSLDKLFNDILLMEQKAVLKGEFNDISNNDVRIINAIGIEEPRNMSQVAKAMSVTVGTLTIAINSLVKKGYVLRMRSTEDRRVVLLTLSARGVDVYKANARFHDAMLRAAIQGFDEEKCRVIEQALDNLQIFFKEYV